MSKKYELIMDDSITIVRETGGNSRISVLNGTKCKLYRIKALVDIPAHNVVAGDLGGYIESELNLLHEGNAWVGEYAFVSGNAVIRGDAFIHGHAKVFGNSQISGTAKVYDNASINGNAQIFGNCMIYGDAQITGAYVYDNAKVYDDANVSMCAKISEDAKVFGNAKVSGYAVVRGTSKVRDHAKVSGNAMVCGNSDICENGTVRDSDEISGYAKIRTASDVVTITRICPDNQPITFYAGSRKQIRVNCKDYVGTTVGFAKFAEKAYGNNPRGTAYMMAISIAENMIKFE